MKKNLRPHELASLTQKSIASAALLLVLATFLMSARKDGGAYAHLKQTIYAHLPSY